MNIVKSSCGKSFCRYSCQANRTELDQKADNAEVSNVLSLMKVITAELSSNVSAGHNVQNASIALLGDRKRMLDEDESLIHLALLVKREPWSILLHLCLPSFLCLTVMDRN